jgi:hypothetical protein
MVDLDGAHIAQKIAAVEVQGYSTWEPKLKRVPPPYDKDHEHGSLLRQKGLVITGAPDVSGDLVVALNAEFERIWPVADMLVGVAETPTL